MCYFVRERNPTFLNLRVFFLFFLFFFVGLFVRDFLVRVSVSVLRYVRKPLVRWFACIWDRLFGFAIARNFLKIVFKSILLSLFLSQAFLALFPNLFVFVASTKRLFIFPATNWVNHSPFTNHEIKMTITFVNVVSLKNAFQ